MTDHFYRELNIDGLRYVATLLEADGFCSEIVKTISDSFEVEYIWSADFPAANIGDASRFRYLESLLHSTAYRQLVELKKKESAQ